MNIDHFKKVMGERSDAELLRILTLDKEQYTTDALTAAEEEWRKRNLTPVQIESTSVKLQATIQSDASKADIPLAMPLRILAFIFPGIINIIFSGTYQADGYDRKASELRKWTLYGLGAYLFIFIAAFLLAKL